LLLPGIHGSAAIRWKTKSFDGERLIVRGKRGPNGEWAYIPSFYHQNVAGLHVEGVHVKGVRCDGECGDYFLYRNWFGLSHEETASMTKEELADAAPTVTQIASSSEKTSYFIENYISFARRGLIISSNQVAERNVIEYTIGDALRVAGSNILVICVCACRDVVDEKFYFAGST
jgi:hypothetical protein